MKHIKVEKFEIDVEGMRDLKSILGELEAAGIDLTGFRITAFNDTKGVLALTKQNTQEISRPEFKSMQNRAKALGLNDDIFGQPAVPTPTLGYLRRG